MGKLLSFYRCCELKERGSRSPGGTWHCLFHRTIWERFVGEWEGQALSKSTWQVIGPTICLSQLLKPIRRRVKTPLHGEKPSLLFLAVLSRSDITDIGHLRQLLQERPLLLMNSFLLLSHLRIAIASSSSSPTGQWLVQNTVVQSQANWSLERQILTRNLLYLFFYLLFVVRRITTFSIVKFHGLGSECWIIVFPSFSLLE